MPELPEVETIRRGLIPHIVGIPITAVDVRLPKIVRPDAASFSAGLLGQRLTDLTRRGKLLIASTSAPDCFLLVHLKMTGQLIYRKTHEHVAGGHPWPPVDGELPNKYSHLILRFEDGGTLYFNDQRQFGFARLASAAEVTWEKAKYGIEPLTPDFTLSRFAPIFRQQSAPLKALLLDQSRISGLGNIYVDEACFHAGVRPTRTVASITLAEQKRLFHAIDRVIAAAVVARGTTMHDYRDADGNYGNYADQLMVYGRGGQPCRRCGTIITKIKIAGRGTHFCTQCQQ